MAYHKFEEINWERLRTLCSELLHVIKFFRETTNTMKIIYLKHIHTERTVLLKDLKF